MSRLTCVLFLAVAMFAGGARAAMTPGRSAFFFNVGYATGKSALSGDNIDGGIATFEFQKMDWEKPVSGGFSIGYGQIYKGTKNAADSTTNDNTITTIPVFLGGRYWLGQGAIQAYLGVSFGVYFSELKVSTFPNTPVASGGDFSSQTSIGGGVGIPLGLSLSIGNTLMLDASYMLNWLWNHEFLDNDLLQAVGVGVGFAFGG